MKKQGTMNKNKRKLLEANGWKVGSAEDFLQLNPGEVYLLETRLHLSSLLRETRKKQNISQGQLAKNVNSSQSRVAKMEAGDPTVSLDLLFKTLFSLGRTKKDIGRFIAAH